ncbi:hypothetical protein DWX57_13305 [Coprococcus sp. AF19-8AC]|nr:hypothetical protein DWX57_13305 [Coprococcus sp. AF19-8AC]
MQHQPSPIGDFAWLMFQNTCNNFRRKLLCSISHTIKRFCMADVPRKNMDKVRRRRKWLN